MLERRAAAPLELFRSTQFTGANIATFTLEGAVGGAFFLLALHLQGSLGFPAVLTFAVGLTITVAPLTSAVLAAVDDRDTGAASGV